jgi:hypothetical protein
LPGKGGYTIADLRDFNNAGPVAFGFESIPDIKKKNIAEVTLIQALVEAHTEVPEYIQQKLVDYGMLCFPKAEITGCSQIQTATIQLTKVATFIPANTKKLMFT